MSSRAASLFLASVVLTTSIARAEETVRSAQEELRRRNLYFGDIDGRRSPEYGEAVKRYQRKKGFAASGSEDPDTLRSLGLLARSPSEPKPKELEWPEEPVLKSDTKLNIPQEARELSLESGIAPESIASRDPIAPARAGRKTPKGAAPAGNLGHETPKAARTVSQAEALELVKDYVHAMSRGDLKEELSLYADHVDYYGNPRVDRRIIEHQLHKYYAKWPSRSYSLGKITGYSEQPRTGEITVTFQMNFSLKNAHGRAKGTTENRIVLNAATSSPRIVAIQESRVRH